MKSGNGECYVFVGFRLDCGAQQLTRHGVAIPLTPRAFDTLLMLVMHAGHVVPKDELIRRVWSDAIVSDDTLTQNIATLRKALGDASDEPRFIRTVPRRGYQFIAPVEQLPFEPAPRLVGRSRPYWWAAALIIVTVGLIRVVIRSAPGAHETSPAARFAITAPEGTTFSPSASLLAVSPDGRSIAFLAARPGAATRLWVRALDELSARELPGTDDAFSPFWSPDGQQIGFVADGKLKRVSLHGESPALIADLGLTGASGPSWSRDGLILFAQPSGIFKISVQGGGAERVTTVDQLHGETGHVLPQFLPDGRHFLYVNRGAPGAGASCWIVLKSLDSPDERRLFSASSQALYAEPGYLIFLREGSLIAQPFDAQRLELSGEPRPLPGVEGVGSNPATPRGMFSVSLTQNGVLAYVAAARSQLTWFDRSGNSLGTVGVPGLDRDPNISPDGRYLATSRYDVHANSRSIWIHDLVHGASSSRLTSGLWDITPAWSRDATTIAFGSGDAPEQVGAFTKNRLTGEQHALPDVPRGWIEDWSRDGRYLIVVSPEKRPGQPANDRDLKNVTSQRGRHMWLVPLDGREPPRHIVLSRAGWAHAKISPDGRWLAYVIDNADTPQIAVQPVAGDSIDPVVVGEGMEPRWREDGRELFFLGTTQQLMAVRVNPGETFRAAPPVPLFRTGLVIKGIVGILGGNQYVNSPDGQRFLLNQQPYDEGPSRIVVLVKWTESISGNRTTAAR